MSGVEFTERGRNTVLALSTALLFALTFLDPVIVLACIPLGAALAYDYWKVRSALGRAEALVEIEPEEVEATLTAGDMFSEGLEVINSSGLSIDLTTSLDDAFLTHSALDGDTATPDLIFAPDLAGKYRLDGIEAEFEGGLGLMRGSGEAPFELSFDVHPRVLAAAVRAARFLAATEGPGEGDRSLELKGAGLEYAGSREYQPEDSLRHLNWKATARLGEPIVKEFYMEGGGGIHLLYDSRAPDPVSRDELSAAFLNATLAAARDGLPIGLTIEDGTHIITNRREMDPKTAVALALRYSLETSNAEVEEFYSVLEPTPARKVRKLMKRLGKESFEKIIEEREKRSENREEVERTMRGLIDSSESNLQIGVVSSLSGDISPFLELEDYARKKGAELSVLQPTKPWKRVEDLARSYRFHEKYSRAYRVFQKRGVSVETDLESFFRSLPSRKQNKVLQNLS